MKTVEEKPLLKVEGLEKSFQKRKVLKGINLNIFSGETIIVMGPSGCGKSTLIRCINRLTEPDDGRIFFAGEEVTGLRPLELSAVRRRIGFVFQQFNLIRRLNVVENVAFALRIDGQPKEEAEAKAMAVLARVGLVERALNFPAELSGGEQQRVGIARALARKPPLMLWDEPTAALDPILVSEVMEIMEELVRSKATTMLVVTHEVGFASRAADRIVFMDQGEIVEEGNPATVLTTPSSEIGEKYKKLLKT
ncbi:MAG TPA: peptide ABC transporter ATP-binding protein [Firmicutes bacterium]|nr:peptide ABC transporter ATP-binding protein [Bacillota bacterium]